MRSWLSLVNQLRSAVGVGLHLLPRTRPGRSSSTRLTFVHVGTESGVDWRPVQSSAVTDQPVRELADVPAIEVISRAAVMLMSSAAEKLGLSDTDPADSPYRDLDEARRVITALAGLVTASVEYLGPHAGPIRDGLKSLQLAFREASAHPDEPGKGPGEKFTGPVY